MARSNNYGRFQAVLGCAGERQASPPVLFLMQAVLLSPAPVVSCLLDVTDSMALGIRPRSCLVSNSRPRSVSGDCSQ
jgi:hypothetical protein